MEYRRSYCPGFCQGLARSRLFHEPLLGLKIQLDAPCDGDALPNVTLWDYLTGYDVPGGSDAWVLGYLVLKFKLFA